MKRYWLIACLLIISLSSQGESPKRPDNKTIASWGQADYILLGEVHDNQGGHALRLEWIKELIKNKGFALAFEQLDAINQPAINTEEETLLKEPSPYTDAQLRALAKSGNFAFKGWHWPYYAPLFNLALTNKMPVVATNLTQPEMMKIMMGQEGQVGLPPDWTSTMTQEMDSRVERGHCNMLPKDMIAPMAEAQIRRDQTMATSLVAAHHASHLPIILVAGNGHLRNDLAVPFWLREFDPQAKIISVAVMEEGNDDNEPQNDFNQVYFVPAQDRTDPCEELKTHHFKMPHQKQ
ncbi:MAG: hypothetical protein B7Z60_03755 [Ferrovum sp. 37-45-19]|uniref:ChaN family lipoprotein n=1 Tax=Ferrovum sp. JA12 TaxID=1356299 RepID=UPI0007023DA5|nr:ChaN family lipoprotein [Ferrovum sp. JA12]OYV78918.1 MAG: hypothetical protein B7Z65_08355 [Ferrovum sp. 21-44-67]OYV94916.1 MAG: hypothetical protein B7Z60_03755 [Ferrovum sp. 37-45-19]HQT82256.1 ChaN family lipoprotein [Ferrovaceae bacterium]KRH79332.1 hypothetical protein FERRO_03970 [Ferrovum sp. JA12]HQU06820.1 ChaN family lipoprotein [Ferrovaceae bacterium]